jgi:hypothetical protein
MPFGIPPPVIAIPIALVVLAIIVVVILLATGTIPMSSGFASFKERITGKNVTKYATNLPLPPSGETVVKSSYRPIKKTTDDHLNMVMNEGMTTGSMTHGLNSGLGSDISPFSGTSNQNEALASIALNNEQRKAHRGFVKKRMVYPRTAATPDDSIEVVTNWRGLRMAPWINPNKTNPSQIYEVPNEENLKDIRRKKYDARI